MTRPIEAVVAEAQQRLEATGRLDIATYLSAYPEHAAELEELLPTMLTLHQEKRWQEASERSRTFAVGLFTQLTAQESPDTVADLFGREREATGLSLEEQARRAGLSPQALRQLAQDRTPISSLDNSAIKQLAQQVTAPFAALVKEIRRLTSLETLGSLTPGAVFTRDSESSTDEEQQALLEKVREAARKPPKSE